MNTVLECVNKTISVLCHVSSTQDALHLNAAPLRYSTRAMSKLMLLFECLAEMLTNLPNKPSKHGNTFKCNGGIVNDELIFDEAILIIFKTDHSFSFVMLFLVRVGILKAKESRSSTDGMASHGSVEFFELFKYIRIHNTKVLKTGNIVEGVVVVEVGCVMLHEIIHFEILFREATLDTGDVLNDFLLDIGTHRS